MAKSARRMRNDMRAVVIVTAGRTAVGKFGDMGVALAIER